MEIFSLNFYKRHLGDIAKSCSDLSQGQMGAYDLLLDWHYANEKPLPLASDKLYRIARAVTQDERDNVDTVLAELFTQTDSGYTHKRAAEEMAKASAQADTNRRIAEEREERKRATNEARRVHEALDESYTNRQPSQTPDSRLHKDQEIPPAVPADDVPVAKKRKAGGQSLQAWIESLDGEMAIREDDPIFAYADSIGLPDEYLAMAWEWFKVAMDGKKKTDWRAHYRNAIRGNWPKLWWASEDGWKLTTAGEQAKRAMEASV